jgi:ectoine hydroxylase-related dioxygenase (phytanoyl-CoA dioxygenase family)
VSLRYRDGAHVRSPTPVVKVFFYLFGVRAEDGCTGIVPGTHLLHAQPCDVVPAVAEDNYAMPNMQRLVMPAGGCALIDTNIWHAALPNRGSRERETVFLRYFSTERAARNFAMPSELMEGAERLGRLAPRTRVLLGLEDG